MNGKLGGTLPIAASEIARQWDTLYIVLYYISLVFFVGVVGAMIWFAIKYRARPGHKSTYIHGNTWIEIIWTVIPTILVMGIFVWGWLLYRDMVTVADGSTEIRAIGKRWDWTFQYSDGRSFTNEVYVPVGKPVKFVVSSQPSDVLHSFFIPNFRLKKDAVPGRFSHITFTPDLVGQHLIFCAEYCGTSHSNMLAKLVVLDEANFDKWNRGETFEMPPPVGTQETAIMVANLGTPSGVGEELTLEQKGEALTKAKACTACHSSDGTPLVGPSYKGLWGTTVVHADGSTSIFNEDYVRESINQPQAKIVKGYENSGIMPPYAGQFSEEGLIAVIAYIKSLK